MKGDIPSYLFGHYSSPKRLEISGIDSIIVDPHNEVLLHWCNIKNPPSVVFHIDNHDDMGFIVPNFEQTLISGNINSWEEYTKQYLAVGNFISVAVHYGIVGVVYHFDPRESYTGIINYTTIYAYGRVKHDMLENRLTTKLDKNECIIWASDVGRPPIRRIITYNEFIEDLNKSQYSLILDIDLDAFLSVHDPLSQELSPQNVRIQKVKTILQSLPNPDMITIARSQTPRLYVPSNRVDILEREVVRCLEEIYTDKK